MVSLFKKHPLAVLLSLIIHGALGGFLVFGIALFETETISVPVVNTVKATVIDPSKIKALAEKKRKIEEKKRRDEQKILDDIKKAKEAELKKIADAKAKEAAEKARIKKAAAEKKERERKKKAQQAKDRADQVKAIQEAVQREEEEKAIASVVSAIKAKVQRNWNQPVGNISGLTSLVEVRLMPGGRVLNVAVKQRSGDDLFDRSVGQATLKASPLPVPADPILFNKYFRKFEFLFDPSKQ